MQEIDFHFAKNVYCNAGINLFDVFSKKESFRYLAASMISMPSAQQLMIASLSVSCSHHFHRLIGLSFPFILSHTSAERQDRQTDTEDTEDTVQTFLSN